MDAETQSSAGIYETKKEASKTKQAVVERWLAEIDLADRQQKDWRKQAQDARDMFRSEGAHENQRFNIQYSNVQTMLPTLYSNRPTPDVRRRYADKSDKSGATRIAAQIIERNLAVSMDCYDFDGVMKAVVQNALITGRGIPRVRHKQTAVGSYIFNKVMAEVVPWRDMVIGPCEVWEDCPWIAFKHLLTREQLIGLNERLGQSIPLEHMVEGAKEEEAQKAPNVFKRAKVWEIWDRAEQKVIWLAESHKAEVLRSDDDPMQLVDFWPVPKPYYYAETSDTMVPMVPAKVVKPLIAELEEITERIQKLTRVIKWRGFADPSLGLTEFEACGDGELAPAGEEILQLVQSGGLEKHIWLMPIREAVEVVSVLNQQREMIKQLIFEVTGISDVIRGATDPNETLGAQELKANFGTMRVQDQQRMVQRMVRDTLRIKAELMCSEFSMDEMMRNAGIKLPTMLDKQLAQQQIQQIEEMAQRQPMEGEEQPQPPQIPPDLEEVLKQPSVEEVEQIIRDDMVRVYTIDIETDSTVQQDMRQVQANMSSFLEGTAAFLQSIGPMVAQGMIKAQDAIDLYQPFARSFHLGKQAEDALERMSDAAQEQQPQGPDPAQVELELKQQLFELEAQAKQQDMALAQQKAESDAQATQQKNAADLEMAQIDMATKQRMAELEFAHKQRMGELEFEQKQRMAALAERQAAVKATQQRESQRAR